MKRFAALFVAFCLSATAWSRAEEADAHFVRVYKLIQDGDTSAGSGQPRSAAKSYREAQAELKNLRKAHPAWNEKIVKFRLNYLAEKLAELGEQATPETPAPPQSAPVSAAPQITEDPRLRQEMNSLNQQLRVLESDKRLLEAKLREALIAQPAAVDPQELRKAEDKIVRLQKENELLKVGLEKQKAKPLPPRDDATLEPTKRALAEANLKLQQMAAANAALEAEQKQLAAQLHKGAANEPPAFASPATTGTQRELDAARATIAAQQTRLNQLTDEKDLLQQQLASSGPRGQLATLKSENESLKKQLSSARVSPRKSARDESLRAELQTAKSELAAQKSANEALRLEKLVLEKQLKESSAVATRGQTSPANKQAVANESKLAREENQRIQRLERERDDLKKKLDAAQGELARRAASPRTGENAKLNRDVAALNARLAALETKKVPYTAEELALFKAPAPAAPRVIQVAANAKSPTTFQLAAENSTTKPAAPAVATEPIRETKPARKSLQDLPPGAGPLVTEAQRAFAARRFDEAEAKYKQALKLDEQSVFLLANLATIQLEQNRFEEAEKNLTLAIANAPDDAFSLSLFGILKFRQEKYDDALNSLSQAVKLDPQNAETQNYLGITLSQKGQRDAAEGALRKAIQLSPGYPSAHYNLAVVYATQQPPFRELARLHYQKATAAGHPKNAELEKLLVENVSTETK